MSLRLFSIRVSIDSQASDDDIIATLLDYFETDELYYTMNNVALVIKSALAGLVEGK